MQDGSVIHVTPLAGTEIGAGATVGHVCVIHAATLGEEALVGNGATILDGARIGARAMVAAGALVPPGTEIPEGMLAVGVPAKVRGAVAGSVRTPPPIPSARGSDLRAAGAPPPPASWQAAPASSAPRLLARGNVCQLGLGVDLGVDEPSLRTLHRPFGSATS